MRTSLNEIKEMEAYIFYTLPKEDALLFDAKLILDNELHTKWLCQKKSYLLIREYGRKKLKEEIKAVHQKLFTEPEHDGFRKKIIRLFHKS